MEIIETFWPGRHQEKIHGISILGPSKLVSGFTFRRALHKLCVIFRPSSDSGILQATRGCLQHVWCIRLFEMALLDWSVLTRAQYTMLDI